MTDMRTAALAPDTERWLRYALRMTQWVQAMPNETDRARVSTQLARSLMFAAGQFVAGAPPREPTVQTTGNRKRDTGAGRPPDGAREILASDVRRAMVALGLPEGTWFVEGVASPALQVLRACVWVATRDPEEPPKKDVARGGAWAAISAGLQPQNAAGMCWWRKRRQQKTGGSTSERHTDGLLRA